MYLQALWVTVLVTSLGSIGFITRKIWIDKINLFSSLFPTAVSEYKPQHEISIPSEAYQGMQLLVGCFMAVLGTVIIILAATICRMMPNRSQKFRADETHLVY